MDKTLHALYDGEIFPADQYRPIMEECIILREKHFKHYEDFIKKIGSPLEKEFERIMDEQLDTLPFEFSQMFIAGFRLGTKMIIEVYEDEISKEK